MSSLSGSRRIGAGVNGASEAGMNGSGRKARAATA